MPTKCDIPCEPATSPLSLLFLELPYPTAVYYSKRYHTTRVRHLWQHPHKLVVEAHHRTQSITGTTDQPQGEAPAIQLTASSGASVSCWVRDRRLDPWTRQFFPRGLPKPARLP